MAEAWAPGDILICVDDEGMDHMVDHRLATVTKDQLYTLTEIIPAGTRHPILIFATSDEVSVNLAEAEIPPTVCVNCLGAFYGFAAGRFKKVIRPDPIVAAETDHLDMRTPTRRKLREDA